MLDDLKAANRRWAEGHTDADPAFFQRMADGQSPPYLWLGCADSRVPPNEILGLGPGELFVHRNVANLASPQDASWLAVLQYAVQVLKVRHVLVVGHYGCGGVAASVDGARHGLVDRWLTPIREVAHAHADTLDGCADARARGERLVELNVIRQAHNVATDDFVREAWEGGRELSVHGWVYAVGTGLLKDLDVTASGPGDLDRLARLARA